mmetsp:Transcript_18243/g.69041  ORF Transcript_18243/g.69041 Transcript_18243/m.69041 type:complete len:234 (+) Transcript_18243:1429-2130(+)
MVVFRFVASTALRTSACFVSANTRWDVERSKPPTEAGPRAPVVSNNPRQRAMSLLKIRSSEKRRRMSSSSVIAKTVKAARSRLPRGIALGLKSGTERSSLMASWLSHATSSSSISRVHIAMVLCAAMSWPALTCVAPSPWVSATALAIHGSGTRPSRGESGKQWTAVARGLMSSRKYTRACKDDTRLSETAASTEPVAMGGCQLAGSEDGVHSAEVADPASPLTSMGQKYGPP